MERQAKAQLFKAGVSILCAAMIAVCALFVRPHSAVLYYVAVPLFALVAALYCMADGQTHAHASRTLLVAGAALCAIVLCYVVYVKTGLSERFNDFDSLKAYILDSGVWGVLVFIGLTVFQVVVLPIPEAVTILLGVAIYGATWAFVLSVIGTIIGSLISFMLGKVFGRRLCNWMFGEAGTEKYARLLGERGRSVFIVMLLFPAFPDDMLCMIAGITNMSYAYFTLVCLATRPVMIGLTSYLGSGVIPFSGSGIPIWISLVCVMFVAFVVISGLKHRIENAKSKI